MTFEMILVLVILVAAFGLLFTEWIRMDLVALLVTGTLALSGLVKHEVIFNGFSNPAVITVWAMYILSYGLVQTGAANQICRHLMRISGNSEIKAIGAIMMIGGIMSAFMNNIGVAALMLPVVLEMCRRTEQSPSRLLMPLAFGTLLGGLVTLIGTSPNLLISTYMREQGMTAFGMFDFTPIGISILVLSTLFMMFIGRHLLPKHSLVMDANVAAQRDLASQYGLQECTFVMRLKPESVLVGKTLSETHLSTAASLTVISLIRGGNANFQPKGNTVLQSRDRLMVQGKLERFQELKAWSELKIERETTALNRLVSEKVNLAEVEIAKDSLLIHNTLDYHTLYRRFGVNVLAIRRNAMLRRTGLSGVPLEAGDHLLLQGDEESLNKMSKSSEFCELKVLTQDEMESQYYLNERLFVLRIPSNSIIAGKSLASSRIGDAFDFRILGVFRESKLQLMPGPDYELMDKDLILIQGEFKHLEVLQGLQELEVEHSTVNPMQVVNSDQITLLELALAPRSGLTGKKVRDIQFREKYGVQLLAIWQRNEVKRLDFDDVELQNGDAIVVMGTKERLSALYSDTDFIALTKLAFAAPTGKDSHIASLIMLAVVASAMSGWLPISVAAVIGASLMVLLGCLTMEDAYRAIDWRTVFLIACMLPLGTAMLETGTTVYLANLMMLALGGYGVWFVLAGLFVLTSLLTLFVPTAALVVIVAPIAFHISVDLNLAPQPFIMVVAIAASASLASPIAHPSNVLVMVPGGYHFSDYLKVGLPLTLLVMTIALVMMPFVWPLQ